MTNWTLNEEEAKKIIETKPRKISESNVFSDIHLPKEERLKHAREILKKWKENSK